MTAPSRPRSSKRPSLSPRSQEFLDRIDAWSERSRIQGAIVKVAITVVGPLFMLAGVAMLVLPGPGFVVIALGMALMALEYSWARTVLAYGGRAVAWVKVTVLPPGSTGARKSVGLAVAAAAVVATTLATGAVTTLIGTHTFL